jgi:pimeloyl-ACP methyl ester carboxylesterase
MSCSMKLRALVFFFLVLIWVPFSSHAAEKIGVVFLHGKSSTPQQMLGIANYLEREGFLVSSPEMPWSKQRSFDKTLEESAAEVTATIEDLRKQGATKVVLVGQSLGTVFAAYYMGRYPIDAVAGVSPGHTPGAPRFLRDAAESVTKAREMVQRGEGKVKAWFFDLRSGGREGSVHTTAEIYLGFFSPDGPLAQNNLVGKLNPKIPMLILANEKEVGNPNDELSRELGHASPESSYELLPGDHTSLIDGPAKPVVAKWIRTLWK